MRTITKHRVALVRETLHIGEQEFQVVKFGTVLAHQVAGCCSLVILFQQLTKHIRASLCEVFVTNIPLVALVLYSSQIALESAHLQIYHCCCAVDFQAMSAESLGRFPRHMLTVLQQILAAVALKRVQKASPTDQRTADSSEVARDQIFEL